MTTIYHQRYRKLIDHYKNIVSEGYTERHHIIPKCMGGDNSEDNLVDLPAKAHYIAHLLLTKMYPENKSLMYAFSCMLSENKNQTRSYMTSRRYEKLRVAGMKAAKKTTTIDGITFGSRTEAAKHFGVSLASICTWIKNHPGKSGNGSGGQYKKVVIDGITFPSRIAAAEHFGCCTDTIRKWEIKNNGKSAKIRR